MKLFDELNNDNFELYAAKHYTNPACLDVDDFKEDLARFKYINRLLRKYDSTGVLSERLILNHLITIYNVFDVAAATRMIFYRVAPIHWPAIKTFLLYLNYLREDQKKDIVTDLYVAKKLQSL
jgi:hypothetical protein